MKELKKIASRQTALVLLMVLTTMVSNAQTNPTPQTLPYNQDFSSLAWTSNVYPAGWQGWRLDTASGAAFNTNAAASNVNMFVSADASTVSRRCLNYDGKIGQLNSANRDIAIAMAINTTGLANINVAYDVMTIRNPYDGGQRTRINEMTLQYCVGTSGTFTNLTGIEYQNNTVNQIGAVTTPQNLQARTIILPSACDNQSEVQLRWVTREASGSGARPSFAVDNINICAAGVDAGEDQSICAGNDVLLNGILNGASSGYWTTSGDGTFLPDSSALNASYTPGPNDILNGTITLTLISTGASLCNASDEMIVSFNGSVPAQPDPITGLPTEVCPPLLGVVASTNHDPNATSYSWFVTSPNSGITFNPPSTTNIQTIDIDSTPNSTYVVRVVAINGCGTSPERTHFMRRSVGTPASVAGDIFACPADIKTYDGSSVTGATSYTWESPAGTLINGSAVPIVITDTLVTVEFLPGFVSGQICQSASVACFTSAKKCITVNSVPPQPGAISGQKKVCTGQTVVPYSVAPIPGATYLWTAPPNATIHFGQGTNQVSVSYAVNFTSGDIKVVAQSACATSPIRSTTIAALTTGTPISRPSAISGDLSNLCAASKTYFAIPLITDASYNWTFPAGTVVNYQYANQVDVTFPSNFNYTTISVSGQLGCTVSLLRTTAAKGAPNPQPVTGPTAVCANSTGNIYSVPVLNPAVTYTWIVPAGVTVSGGQGTPTASIDFGATAGVIVCKTDNACGNASGTLLTSITCRLAGGDVAEAEAAALTIYPNPASDVLTVELVARQQGMAVINLTDITGKTVYSNSFAVAEGLNTHQFDVSRLSKGIYMLKAVTDDGIIQHKIIVD